jgi:hypothetical protein
LPTVTVPPETLRMPVATAAVPKPPRRMVLPTVSEPPEKLTVPTPPAPKEPTRRSPVELLPPLWVRAPLAPKTATSSAPALSVPARSW